MELLHTFLQFRPEAFGIVFELESTSHLVQILHCGCSRLCSGQCIQEPQISIRGSIASISSTIESSYFLLFSTGIHKAHSLFWEQRVGRRESLRPGHCRILASSSDLGRPAGKTFHRKDRKGKTAKVFGVLAARARAPSAQTSFTTESTEDTENGHRGWRDLGKAQGLKPSFFCGANSLG